MPLEFPKITLSALLVLGLGKTLAQEIPLQINTNLELRWQGVPNKAYRVESSPDLLRWETAGFPFQFSLGGALSERIQVNGECQFFRVQTFDALTIGPAPNSLAGMVFQLNSGTAPQFLHFTDQTGVMRSLVSGQILGTPTAHTYAWRRLSLDSVEVTVQISSERTQVSTFTFASPKIGKFTCRDLINGVERGGSDGVFAVVPSVTLGNAAAPTALDGSLAVFLDGGVEEKVVIEGPSATVTEGGVTTMHTLTYLPAGASSATLYLNPLPTESNAYTLEFITSNCGKFTRQRLLGNSNQAVDTDSGVFILVPNSP